MKGIRILIADDHEAMRRGVRAVLEAKPEWEVCAEAATGREAVEKTKQLKPDVVILDISMPELGGLEATRQILKAVPQTEILIHTMHDSELQEHVALAAGARGYVLKSGPESDIIAAVEALCQHKPFFSTAVSQMVLEGYLNNTDLRAREGRPRLTNLTPREQEIVQLLAEGKTNKEAARVLGICVKTVETHRGNVMRKLNLHSITDLVHYAIRNKIAGGERGWKGEMSSPSFRVKQADTAVRRHAAAWQKSSLTSMTSTARRTFSLDKSLTNPDDTPRGLTARVYGASRGPN